MSQSTIPPLHFFILLLCLFTTAFTALGFETIIVLQWSIVQGFAYSILPLFLAAAFTGIAAGAILSGRHDSPVHHTRTLPVLDFVLVICIISINWFDRTLSLFPSAAGIMYVCGILFLVHLILGIQFRIIAITLIPGSRISENSGIIYGMDSLGGAVAAVVLGFSLPIMGLHTSLWILSGLKLVSFVSTAITARYRFPGAQQTDPGPVIISSGTPFMLVYMPGFLAGAISIITQSGLIRFTIRSIGESHLSYGVPLGIWLGGVCLGSIIYPGIHSFLNRGSPSPSKGSHAGAILLVFLLTQLPLNLSIFLFYGGEYISYNLQLFLIAVFMLFPLAFTSGAVFPYLSARSAHHSRVPVLFGAEALGSVTGGLFFFMTLNYWGDWSVAFLTGLGWFTLIGLLRGKWTYMFLLPAAGFLLLGFLNEQIDFTLDKKVRQTRDEELVFQANSVSGRLEIVKKNSNTILRVNHLPMYSTRTDRVHNEALVHIPSVYLSRPERILIIGGCTGGALRETLKYDPEEVVYCEIDPAFPAMTNRFFPEHFSSVNTDTPPTMAIRDGWELIGESVKHYDLVILDLPTPVNLQLARFFTVEGFKRISESLREEGVLSLILPSSYIHASEWPINARIINNLKLVFPRLDMFIPYYETERRDASRPGPVSEPLQIPYMEIVIASKSPGPDLESKTDNAHWDHISREYFLNTRLLGNKYFSRVYPETSLKDIGTVTLDRLYLPALKWVQKRVETRPVFLFFSKTDEIQEPMFVDANEMW